MLTPNVHVPYMIRSSIIIVKISWSRIYFLLKMEDNWTWHTAACMIWVRNNVLAVHDGSLTFFLSHASFFWGGGGIAVVGNFASGTCSKCMPFLHAAAREECILSTCRSLLYTSQYFLHDSLECTYIWPGCCIVQMAPPRIHILYKPSKWLKLL